MNKKSCDWKQGKQACRTAKSQMVKDYIVCRHPQMDVEIRP